jgi:hypothetical protein
MTGQYLLVITQFCLNQSFKVKTVLILLLKSEGFEWDSKMLVSSADKKELIYLIQTYVYHL